MRGDDVLAIAQTGTGKTAAFAIPIIHSLQMAKIPGRRDGIRCLVMVPTRELAIQLAEVFETLAKKTKIKVFALYGGVEQDKQIKKLQDGVDILISTPGRMFDLISQGHLRTNRIHTLVLDEADHMLDLGFIKDITDMMRHLPKKRQTLFFSATINPIIKKLAYSIVNNPIKIEISPKDPVAKKVDHYVMYVEMDDKRFFLERLVREEEEAKILVFVRTKVRAERVKKAMDRVGVESITMHGDKAQSDRLNVMGAFKTGKVKLLIATDVSARGIDIPNVDFVVNYDLPDYTENYVHRVGRTGRGDQRGIAYTFCSAGEKDLLDEIQSFLGKKINVMELKGDVYTEVKTFSDMDNLSIDRIIGDLDKLVFNKKKKKKRKK
tara:strand:+ start:316 stop:1452 length:1137 start_codon:yes stop_codon:yes gene_type:complete